MKDMITTTFVSTDSPECYFKNGFKHNEKLRTTGCRNWSIFMGFRTCMYTYLCFFLRNHVNIVYFLAVVILGAIVNVNGEQSAYLANTLSTQAADEGKSATLPCISETREGDVRWTGPNGQLLIQNKPLSGPWHDTMMATINEDTSLRIYSTSVENDGIYTCNIYLLNELQDSRQVKLVVHDATPKIDPVERYILSENETLQLTCRGGFFITWHYPDSVAFRVHISITTHIFGSSTQSWQQTSILTVESVEYRDTGEYLCAHHHASDYQNDVGDNHDAIYIFVSKTKDSTTLFIPTSQTTVNAYVDDQSIVIPCRVTNPSTKVSLVTELQGRMVDTSELSNPQYDPEVGFVVEEQLHRLGDELRCLGQRDKIVDEQVFTFNYIGKPEIKFHSQTNTSMVNNKSELLIMESEGTLELSCAGPLPMLWSYPDDCLPKLMVQSTAQLDPETSAGLLYRSVLRITNISLSDTGEYACVFVRYVGTPLETEQRRAIYVYITSEEEIFLPNKNLVVKVYPNKAFIVPCRISNPEYSIKYTTFISTTTTPFQLGINRNVTYDPKVGFTFGIDDGGKILPNLHVFCWAIRNNGLPVTTEVYFLHYVGHNKGTLIPYISASSDMVIQGQTDVNITCEVSIAIGLLGLLSSDFDPNFEIYYPGRGHNQSNYHFSDGVQEKYNISHKIVYYILFIEHVSLVDMGTYTCGVYNAAGRANATTELVVLEHGYVKIRNTTAIGLIEVINGSEDFCELHFEVEAFPDFRYEWLKDGKDLSMETGLQQLINGSAISLCISRVEEMHGGNYTLLVSNQYQDTSVKIQLDVLVMPSITMTTAPKPIRTLLPNLFKMGEEYELNCSATGNPIPRVWWEWFACEPGKVNCKPPEDPGDFANDWQSLSGAELESSSSATEQYFSLVVVKATQPGYYRCVAESPKFKINTIKVLKFFLTEVEDGFAIQESAVVRYQSESIELSCKASLYTFNYLRWKRMNPVTGSEEFVVPYIMANDPDRKIKLKNDKTTLSHWLRILIASANRNDSGEYYCIGKPFYAARMTISMNVTVKELLSPLIKGGLQNNTKIDLARGTYTLSCNASGDPHPAMSWRKDTAVLKRGPMIPTSQPNLYTSALTVVASSVEDGGQYTCEASNIGGNDSSSANILILESPRAEADEELVRGKLGRNATLRCEVFGIPHPTITWKHTTINNEERIVPRAVYQKEGQMLYFKKLMEEDRGVYECIASNELGQHSERIVLNIEVPPSTSETFIIPVTAVAVGLGIILVILTIIVTKKWCSSKSSSKAKVLFDDEGNYLRPSLSIVPSHLQDIIDRTPYDPRWEFPRERLQLGTVIGKGAFGMVVRGNAVGIGSNSKSTVVAVKTLREDAAEAEYKALMGELKMLIHIGRHLNVVNFLGACTQQPPILLIVEYCRYGNLCHFLRSKRTSFVKDNDGAAENSYSLDVVNSFGLQLSRVTRSLEDIMSDEKEQDYTLIPDDEEYDSQPLTSQELVCFAFQIARGMEFLASKKCIHRDLAARNVLITDHNIVKICDFGLSRNLYYDPDYIASSKSLLPIKWMAPESIFDKVFTTQSDVWSFGIVMWEIFSLGGSPYPGFQVDERFYDKLKHGYRMCKPDYASSHIYQITLECWHTEPKQRPTFGELVKTLGERLEDKTREEYMDLESSYEKEYWEIPDNIHQHGTNCAQDGLDILDELPDHPPIPVPRTLERSTKQNSTKSNESTEEPLSLQIPSTNRLEVPPVSNRLSPRMGNPGLSRMSFPSNNDINATFLMLPNPILDQGKSLPLTPAEENGLLKTETSF